MAEASGEPMRIGSTRCGSVCSRRMTTGVLAGTSTRTPTNSIAITTRSVALYGAGVAVGSAVEMVAQRRMHDRRTKLAPKLGERRQRVDSLLTGLRIPLP